MSWEAIRVDSLDLRHTNILSCGQGQAWETDSWVADRKQRIDLEFQPDVLE